jgi:hypothetical protein
VFLLRSVSRRREISFSQGAEWKALISKYIGTIPLSGDASCTAEQSMPGVPPTPVTSAMIAKVGVAARQSQSATPNEAVLPSRTGSPPVVPAMCLVIAPSMGYPFVS